MPVTVPVSEFSSPAPAAALRDRSLRGHLPEGLSDRLQIGLIVAMMPLAWCYLGNAINLPVLFYVSVGLTVLATLAFTTLLRTVPDFHYPRTLLLALALYLAFVTFSRLISLVPETSAFHWWMRFAFVTGVLACLTLGRHVRHREFVRLALAATCVGCALWGIIEFVDSPRRTAGPFMDANNFALVCVVGVFLCLPNLARTGSPPGGRIALWVGLTLLSLGVALAYSRAISLIWLIGTLGFVVLAWGARPARANLVAYAAVGVVCFLLAVALVPETGARVTGDGDLPTTLDVRRAMFDSALAMWRDHPLLGMGIGTFRMFYPAYRDLGDQVTAGNTPHNDYVLALSEGGPLLLAFYLVLLLAIAWRGLAAARVLLRGGADDGMLASAALAIAGGSIMVHASVNFVAIALSLQFLLGCIVGLLFACSVAPQASFARDGETGELPPTHAASSITPRQRLLVAAVALTLVLGPLRVLGQDAVTYAVILGQQGIPFAELFRANGQRYVAFLEWMDANSSRRGLPSYGAATYYEKRADLASGDLQQRFGLMAQEKYAVAIERLPTNHRAYLAWAQLSTRPWQRDLDKAATLARIASSIDPTDALVYETRVRIELLRDRPEAAYRILRDEFFPWSYYGASTRALVAEKLLLQLRRWSLEYGKGPPLEDIDARLYRAQRVIEAVRFERALGWRQ